VPEKPEKSFPKFVKKKRQKNEAADVAVSEATSA
jgi:hypothetical protein